MAELVSFFGDCSSVAIAVAAGARSVPFFEVQGNYLSLKPCYLRIILCSFFFCICNDFFLCENELKTRYLLFQFPFLCIVNIFCNEIHYSSTVGNLLSRIYI